MLKSKMILAAFAVAGLGVLGGCATAETSDPGAPPIAQRHQHMRDAKQGSPASTAVQPQEQARAKALHDHREMK